MMRSGVGATIGAFSSSLWMLIFAAILLMTSSVIGPSNAAAQIAKPTGDTILEIDGAIGQGNDGDRAVFDLSMLESFPADIVRTMTPWTDGVQEFRGVRLVNLLQAVKARGTSVVLTALNEYSITLDLPRYLPYQPLIAYQHNGAEMPVSEKGPLWLVFPQDDNPAIDRADVHDLWVWQLYRITVR